MLRTAKTFIPLCFGPAGSSILFMGKTKESEFEKAAPAPEAEDRATLEAIDEGLRDAKAGRTLSLEEVRERLPKWISASSSRKGR